MPQIACENSSPKPFLRELLEFFNKFTFRKLLKLAQAHVQSALYSMLGEIDGGKRSSFIAKRSSLLLHPYVTRNSWNGEEIRPDGDGQGSLQYDMQAGCWNMNMYLDPQEGIQAPMNWRLAKHAQDMFDPSVKSELEEAAEAVCRLWSVTDPDVFETGFFVGPRLVVSRLRLGTNAAKLENMSIAGYVSCAAWGETCPKSAKPVKCLWASDNADFGLFLITDIYFRAPSHLELPDIPLVQLTKTLQYGNTIVAIAYNRTPDRITLEERNLFRYQHLDEDDRPKIPDDVGPILHPNAKTVASGYIVGLPSKDDDLNNISFRVSASLWAGSSGGPVFVVQDQSLRLVGMVSLNSGDANGNDASFLFDWHYKKMNVAIKRAKEQHMYLFSSDEILFSRRLEQTTEDAESPTVKETFADHHQQQQHDQRQQRHDQQQHQQSLFDHNPHHVPPPPYSSAPPSTESDADSTHDSYCDGETPSSSFHSSEVGSLVFENNIRRPKANGTKARKGGRASAKAICRRRYRNISSNPRTILQHYAFVMIVLLLFGVLQLHPKN